MKIIEWELLKPRNIATIILIVMLWQLLLAPIIVSIGKSPDSGDDTSN